MSLKLSKKKIQEHKSINMVPLMDGGTILDDAFVKDGMSLVGRIIKRSNDILLSLIMLVLSIPLFLFISLVIKISDGGKVFYSQWRIGKYGRPFKIYKFRTMRENAETKEPQLSCTSDERVFKVGQFLRTHHLDELPQLWNVLIGDMSFVGYRPERKFFINQIMKHDKRYACLYQSRPGVTSYATLYNGYTDTMEKMLRRLEYDLYYLKHRSFCFDMKILWLTFWDIVSGKKI